GDPAPPEAPPAHPRTEGTPPGRLSSARSRENAPRAAPIDRSPRRGGRLGGHGAPDAPPWDHVRRRRRDVGSRPADGVPGRRSGARVVDVGGKSVRAIGWFAVVLVSVAVAVGAA